MKTKILCGERLSALGFGTMRLPMQGGEIDVPAVREMVDYAIKHGVNYFDTAYPYHEGKSETVIGEILSEYPRDSYFLATKYPGHQYVAEYKPREIFEEQLKKCRVDYFDFYLLHNVNENSIKTYKDERWGILPYFLEERKKGRIKHLGFSFHGDVENLKEFLAFCGDEMEFCQIQYNYLDASLQNADEKYALLTAKNIPVWVMEPVRGGKLANLPSELEEKRKAVSQGSTASTALRWLFDKENVGVILSGMSDFSQMQDNVQTFDEYRVLSGEEKAWAKETAERLKHAVPCTGCRYCVDGCPKGLDIPRLLAIYNDLLVSPSVNIARRLDAFTGKTANACIKCGKCARACPQGINVPEFFADFVARMEKVPKWADVCREREEAAKRMQEKK